MNSHFYPDNSVTSQTPSNGAETGRRSGTTLPAAPRLGDGETYVMVR